MSFTSMAELFSLRMGQRITVMPGNCGLFVTFGRGSYTLTGLSDSVIETTGPNGEIIYYALGHVVEVRV